MNDTEEEAGKLDRLEREVEELKPEHNKAIEHVDSALRHLAAATSDLEQVRRVEEVARRK